KEHAVNGIARPAPIPFLRRVLADVAERALALRVFGHTLAQLDGKLVEIGSGYPESLQAVPGERDVGSRLVVALRCRGDGKTRHPASSRFGIGDAEEYKAR